MKEMIYQKDVNFELLHEEDYKGFKIIIVSHGIHPCAYIGMDKKYPLYKISYHEISNMEYYGCCHGGFTYSDFGVKGFYSNLWFLGWDFAHCGDYMGYDFGDASEYRKDDKKWTTKEILENAKKQVDELCKLKFVKKTIEILKIVEEKKE